MIDTSWQLAHLSATIPTRDYRTLPRPKGTGGRWSARVIIPMDKGVVCVQHTKDDESYWLFPGGKIERYETIPDAAVREVAEETHLIIKATRLLYIREFYHTKDIEFYVQADYVSGDLALGTDPELGAQLLSDVRVISFDDLENDDSLTFYPIGIRKRLRRDIQTPSTKALYLGHTL